MKKLILSVIFGLVFFFVVPSNVKAACYTIPLGIGCQSDAICSGGAAGFCCSNQTECTQKAESIKVGQEETKKTMESTDTFIKQLNAVESKIPGFKFTGPSANLGALITVILRYVFSFAGVALLLFFIYGGFQLFTSAGDQKKVAEGKATITNALIGFVIVFIAFWIVQLFGNLLGLQSLIGPTGIFQ